MHRQTPIHHHRSFRQLAHIRVHLRVHEPERQRFVSDESLVVGLGVRNGTFHVAPVGQSVCELLNLRPTCHCEVYKTTADPSEGNLANSRPTRHRSAPSTSLSIGPGPPLR